MRGEEGMGKSTVYKKFPTGVEYFLSFLRVPLKKKTGINGTFISTLQSWDFCLRTVLVVWLTFHKHRIQKASWFLFKVSLKDSIYW